MEQIVINKVLDTDKEQEREKSKIGTTIEAILFPSSSKDKLYKCKVQAKNDEIPITNTSDEIVKGREKKALSYTAQEGMNEIVNCTGKKAPSYNTQESAGEATKNSDRKFPSLGEKASTGGKAKRSEQSEKQLAQIPISQIVANPNQPRQDFSETEILKLADSIRQHGVIQPITVRKTGQLYELIAGERRLRALKELNWELAPCIVAEISEEASAEIAIIENLLRQDLNIFEQASAIQTLIDTYSLTQEQVAEKLSSSQSYIANKLRLLRLTQEEKDILLKNRLTERHARALLRVNDQNLRKKALNIIVENELNVSATEELINGMLSTSASGTQIGKKEPKRYKDTVTFYNAIKTALNCAKESDIGVKFRKIVGDSFTEITISIPNSDPISDLGNAEK